MHTTAPASATSGNRQRCLADSSVTAILAGTSATRTGPATREGFVDFRRSVLALFRTRLGGFSLVAKLFEQRAHVLGVFFLHCQDLFHHPAGGRIAVTKITDHLAVGFEDRKSTRLNSSHMSISYAVFCLKKKKKHKKNK